MSVHLLIDLRLAGIFVTVFLSRRHRHISPSVEKGHKLQLTIPLRRPWENTPRLIVPGVVRAFEYPILIILPLIKLIFDFASADGRLVGASLRFPALGFRHKGLSLGQRPVLSL